MRIAPVKNTAILLVKLSKQKNNLFIKQRLLFFISILTVLTQLLVFYPISMWIQNQFNFDVDLSNSLNVIYFVILAISVFSFTLALLTPSFLREFLFPFFLILSALFFVQYNILVWDYGVFDGKQIDFTKYSTKGWVDLILWVIGIYVLFVKRLLVVKQASTILLFSTLVSTSVFITTVWHYDFNKQRPLSYTEDNKFTFSKDKNIIVFVLDAFQTGLFWEIIDTEPDLKKELSGFTFYPNTTSVFAKTYPTIPVLLTGEVYQKKQPILTFFNEVYKNSLLTKLIDSNWDVGLYPYIKKIIPVNNSYMSNFSENISTRSKVENYFQALDLSLFRVVPHKLKRKIYNEGDFIIEPKVKKYISKKKLFINKNKNVKRLKKTNRHHGLNFLENLKYYASLNSNIPTFKFYHLLMPHGHFVLNRDLEHIKKKIGLQAYKDYAYASIKIMIAYLSELKKIGVYNNSTIIILADHGGGEYTRESYNYKNKKFEKPLKYGKVKASAKPLFLIKNFNSKQPFTISKQKPISLVDIAPTIASIAKINIGSKKGQVIDNISVSKKRERIFYYYNFIGWDSKYLQDFDVFKINVNVFDDKSWEFIDQLKPAKNNNNPIKSTYQLNKTIKFGNDIKTDADYQNMFIVNSDNYLNNSSVSTKNLFLNITLPLDKPLKLNQTYKLEIETPKNSKSSKINIKFNEQNYIFNEILLNDNKQIIFFELINKSANNTIKFKVNKSNLTSHNSIQVSKIKIENINVLPLSRTGIDFSKNMDGYHPNGFWVKTKKGRWSLKKQTSLHIKLPKVNVGEDNNIYLQLDINKFYQTLDVDIFQIYFADLLLTPISTTVNNGEYSFYYEVSTKYFNPHEIIQIKFVTDKIVSPSEVKNSKDVRKKGALFSTLKLINFEEVPVNTYLKVFK